MVAWRELWILDMLCCCCCHCRCCCRYCCGKTDHAFGYLYYCYFCFLFWICRGPISAYLIRRSVAVTDAALFWNADINDYLAAFLLMGCCTSNIAESIAPLRIEFARTDCFHGPGAKTSFGAMFICSSNALLELMSSDGKHLCFQITDIFHTLVVVRAHSLRPASWRTCVNTIVWL